MGIQKVMIVGSGLMGSGIAQVCAQAGLDVLLNDVSGETLEKALKNIEWSVGKLIDKGILEGTRSTILSRISTIQDLGLGKDVDLAIEAVFENCELKSGKQRYRRVCHQPHQFPFDY